MNQTQTQKNANLPAKKSPVKNHLVTWAETNLPALLKSSAAWLESPEAENKPATKRMIKRNIKYVIERDDLNNVWTTPEGARSIQAALKESFHYGATMPEMGSIVPFGSVVEFIPAVECFEFALKNGINAPFESLTIEVIFENDKCKTARKNGNFDIEFENIPPRRGDPRGVAVYGLHKPTGKIMGEVYEVERLLDKARQHSASFRYYVTELNLIAQLRAGNKLLKEGDREYFMKAIPKKDGSTWNKKIYVDEVSNPYDNADLPEMLRKLAGKTFCRPYMKIRNAEVMAGEWGDGEDDKMNDIIDAQFEKAEKQYQADGQDYEEPDGEQHPESESPPAASSVKRSPKTSGPAQNEGRI